MDFKARTVTVVGLGKSGLAASRFLARQGARVRVTEARDTPDLRAAARELRRRGVWVELGGHRPACLTGATLVVTSPGVPKESLPIRRAKKKRIPVISEVELASYFCPGIVVGITGSNGKTTTSHLFAAMLRAAGRPVVLCGNVGTPFIEALPKIRRNTVVVLELSSFQLEDCVRFRPRVAVVLNLSPNHLNRHGTFARYAAAKANIFKNQTPADTLVVSAEDARVRKLSRRARSRVVFFHASDALKKINPTKCRLRGQHNLRNIAACLAAAKVLKVPFRKYERAIYAFKTLEHRIEAVGRVRGVTFVNDSKSTTVDSTRAALEAMDGRVILIAGGRDKGSDFKKIAPLLHRRAKRVVLYGESRFKIAVALGQSVVLTLEPKFEDAVRAAFQCAQPKDTVLLSPMCTSFDQFSSYEERGLVFKKTVRALKGP